MPIYVYKFVDTDETIEVQQSFTDDALTEAVHPVTGQTMPVKKVFLPVGVTFKGGGFYKTDSRDSGKSSSKPSGGSSGTSDGGASPKSESSSSTPTPGAASSGSSGSSASSD